jgi:hypothetical protein
VGGEVFHNADVADATREGSLPTGRDLEDRSKITAGDPVAHLDDRGVVALDVSNAADQARRGEGVGQAT